MCIQNTFSNNINIKVKFYYLLCKTYFVYFKMSSSKKPPPILFSPSEEQQKIIDALKNKENVIVNAVAGSGKTTTILGIAHQMPDINILQITYNKALKLEVEEKIKQQKLKNIKIYTYHGLCCGCYDHEARSDDKIINILINDTPLKPRKTHIQYSIVVIDEAQDMTELYFKLVYKFLKDLKYKVNLLILGDNFQGIYEFKGADSRYLTLADKIFISHNPFIKLSLNTSYRLTKTVARFINEVMMDKRISINAPKIGDPIKYFKINTNDANEIGDIANIIINLIKDGRALADDFFILAPSIKNMKPLKYLENYLVRKNIQCFVPISEDTQLKDKIIKNKIVFTTFHQSKGRERPYCIIIGFDNSYFSYYDKESDFNVCPNTLYVAASRASKQLILIEDIYNNTCSFIKMPYLVDGGIGITNDGGIDINNSGKIDDKIEEKISLKDIESFIKISKLTENQTDTQNQKQNLPAKTRDEYKEQILLNRREQEHKTSVTDLIKFINESILAKISILVDKLYKIHKPILNENIVEFPTDIKTSSITHEEVSDINGLAIPAMLDNPGKDKNAIYKAINDKVVKLKNQGTNFGKLHLLIDAFKKVVYPCKDIKDWLYLSNLYIAFRSEYYYKINQIKDYNWLNEDIVNKCHKNITNNIMIKNNIVFEKPISIKYCHKKYGIMSIGGCIDIDDKKNIWELKCVDELTIEHKLQLIVYCWLCRQDNIQNDDDHCIGTRKCFLLNIKSGEVLELIAHNDIRLKNNIFDDLDKIMDLLFDNKYLIKEKINDNDFIQKHINDITPYVDIIDKFQVNNINNYDISIDVSGYSSNSDTNSDINSVNEIIDFNDNDYNFGDNNISDDESFNDSDESIESDYTKLKVNEIIDLCNKEFTDDNRIKNIKKKKKQELIDILLNLIKNRKENNKITLDF